MSWKDKRKDRQGEDHSLFLKRVDDLLKNVYYELDRYVNKELQDTDHFHFSIFSLLFRARRNKLLRDPSL